MCNCQGIKEIGIIKKIQNKVTKKSKVTQNSKTNRKQMLT
jgi:hypothetical protein